MAPPSFEVLLQALGPAGLFIGYLIWDRIAERKERELRRKADVRLAVALERFCQRFVGRPLPEPAGDDDVP